MLAMNIFIFIFIFNQVSGDCELIQNLQDALQVRYKENTVGGKTLIDPTSLEIGLVDKKGKLFTSTSDRRKCGQGTDEFSFSLFDQGSLIKELAIGELSNSESLTILDIDQCKDYVFRVFIKYRNGIQLSRNGTFGPFFRELTSDQIGTLSIKEKDQKKTDSVTFSAKGTKIIAKWKPLCGRSMAIFINDGKQPAKVLDKEQLESGETELEVGSCQVFETGNIFAEMFLSDKYPGGNNFYEQSNLRNTLVTHPVVDSFWKFNITNSTIFQDGDLAEDCIKSHYLQISLYNKNGSTEGLPILKKQLLLPNTLDNIFENFRYIRACTEYEILISVDYELVTGKSEETKDLILLKKIVKTNSNGGFFNLQPQIDINEDSLMVTGRPCNFKYSLALKNRDTANFDSRLEPTDISENGVLPLKNLSSLMVTFINYYKKKLKELNTQIFKSILLL